MNLKQTNKQTKRPLKTYLEGNGGQPPPPPGLGKGPGLQGGTWQGVAALLGKGNGLGWPPPGLGKGRGGQGGTWQGAAALLGKSGKCKI